MTIEEAYQLQRALLDKICNGTHTYLDERHHTIAMIDMTPDEADLFFGTLALFENDEQEIAEADYQAADTTRPFFA